MLRSVKSRIVIAVAFPFVLSIVLCAILIGDKMAVREANLQTAEVLLHMDSKSALIHELQAERGLTISADHDRSAQAALQALTAQREKTNAALDVFLRSQGGTALPQAENDTKDTDVPKRVADVRAQFNDGSLPAREIATEYTRLVTVLVDALRAAAPLAKDPDIIRSLGYLVLLEAMKDHTGLERAFGAAVLNSAPGSVERSEATERFRREHWSIEGLRDALLRSVSDQRLSALQDLSQGPLAERLHDMHAAIVETGRIARTRRFRPPTGLPSPQKDRMPCVRSSRTRGTGPLQPRQQGPRP